MTYGLFPRQAICEHPARQPVIPIAEEVFTAGLQYGLYNPFYSDIEIAVS